jgi:radical SAM superfamily enzyme YgiQ (UPF0313 family)
VAAIEDGATSGRFEATRYTTDVRTSPIPRFDLIRFDHYLQMSVQFSRGCRSRANSDDIIESVRAGARAKSPQQVLDELDALYRLGWRGHVDVVDDTSSATRRRSRRSCPSWPAG